MKSENLIVVEEIAKKNTCPQCQNNLQFRWLSQKEQEKQTFELNFSEKKEFKKGSEFSQIEIYFCQNCNWQSPSLFIENQFENIPFAKEQQKYFKERQLVEKIAAILLPNQPIKVRFVKNIENEKSKGGWTKPFTHPKRGEEIYCVCLAIEYLQKCEKENPGDFLDCLAHELAHVTNEVFKNPQFNPNSNYLCRCGTAGYFGFHKTKGHDKIWHDKYDEFRERIKNENLANGSGYQALGKEFESKERKEQKNNQPSTSQLPNLSFWDKNKGLILGFSLGFLTCLMVNFLFWKRRKKA